MQSPADLPLRDIHLPDPISWWPVAPGWWLLAVLLLLSLAGIWWWRKRKAAKRFQPLALAAAELDILRTARSGDATLAVELSAWLRRVCLAVFPRTDVASLNGKRWLAYLDEAAGQPLFGSGPGQVMADVAYRPEPGVDSRELLALCERWLVALRGRHERGAER